jgi:hypothetical protein
MVRYINHSRFKLMIKKNLAPFVYLGDKLNIFKIF